MKKYTTHSLEKKMQLCFYMSTKDLKEKCTFLSLVVSPADITLSEKEQINIMNIEIMK